MLLAGCNAYPSYGASRGATKQGQETFKLYSGMMTTGIIVGGAVGLLILYTVLRYRRRSDDMPQPVPREHPDRGPLHGIPIIIVPSCSSSPSSPKTTSMPPAGQRHLHLDRRAGRPHQGHRVPVGLAVLLPDLNVSVAGETTNGPGDHGPQMVVPVGETVQILLVSDDVIHGFYVRDFNFSRYALPGVANRFDLDVLHAGTYNGQCTQICGLYHSEMLFTVEAVTRPPFASVGDQRDRHRAHAAALGTPGPKLRPPYDPHHQWQRLARHRPTQRDQ